MEILTGILLGLSTLLFIGAVFFYLIKTTLASGRKAGFVAATGVIASDVIYVILLLFGFADVLKSTLFTKWFSLIGSIILILLGITYLLKKQHISKVSISKKRSLFSYFIKGFALNFINPFVAAVWVGFFAINQSQFETSQAITISLVSTLIIIYITDLLKVYYAKKLSHYLNATLLEKAFKIIGIIMLIFGLRLGYSFFYN